FSFVSADAATAWVNAYYNTFIKRQELLGDYQTNPAFAVVSPFMCAETDELAAEKAEGWTFFQFALVFYNSKGPFEPGTVNLWDEYQAWKQTPAGQKASNTVGLVGSPDTIRERLKMYENAGVDQVILLNQAGKNTHDDICASLELFADQVMPDFHERDAEHQQWKQAVLAGDIELEDIDTDIYQIISNQTPVERREEIERKKREARAKSAAGIE
ncbi:MAG: LLM class flavin-dependent oxidoreductase, partial [Actinomycetota bacterium]|nr:LLM class flavin-dependent oxidoreductase [Actinomycetota bacterium]